MAKDAIGNEIHIGDKLFFQGMVYNVKDVQENRILGGKTLTGKSVSGIKVPDVMTLEIDLPFNSEQPFNGVVCMTPPDYNDAKPN